MCARLWRMMILSCLHKYYLFLSHAHVATINKSAQNEMCGKFARSDHLNLQSKHKLLLVNRRCTTYLSAECVAQTNFCFKQKSIWRIHHTANRHMHSLCGLYGAENELKSIQFANEHRLIRFSKVQTIHLPHDIKSARKKIILFVPR